MAGTANTYQVWSSSLRASGKCFHLFTQGAKKKSSTSVWNMANWCSSSSVLVFPPIHCSSSFSENDVRLYVTPSNASLPTVRTTYNIKELWCSWIVTFVFVPVPSTSPPKLSRRKLVYMPVSVRIGALASVKWRKCMVAHVSQQYEGKKQAAANWLSLRRLR